VTRIRMEDGREFRAAGDPHVIGFLLARARELRYDFVWPDGADGETRIPHGKISGGRCSRA
jgi:hypothetical protein